MKAYWHILSDNIMEQYEFTSLLHDQEYGFSLTPPDITELKQKDIPIVLLVHLHSTTFDACSLFRHLHESMDATSLHIIAYTDKQHDHEGIHRAKSLGVKYVCTKEQVKGLLSHIQKTVS